MTASTSTKNTCEIVFGQISFTNTLPVVLPLEKDILADTDCVRMEFASPADLNRRLSDGALDVSAMSSFFAIESRDFELFDRVSISSQGPVGSVLFFTSCQPEELSGKVIEVTDTSATSVRMLQILLKEQFGASPVLKITSSPAISPTSSGALVIGDQALLKDAGSDWNQKYIRFDLGQWWHQLTGLPAVFGVWGARKAWVKEHEAEFQMLSLALEKARQTGLDTMFESVVETAQERTGLSGDRLRLYFKQELDFSFTEKHSQGLRLYEELCRKHSLLDRN